MVGLIIQRGSSAARPSEATSDQHNSALFLINEAASGF